MIFNSNSRLKDCLVRSDYGLMGIVMLVTFVIAMITGCQRSHFERLSRVAVKGTVFVDHQPLKQGVLCFIPLEGAVGPKTRVVIEDGQFEATEQSGPVPGKHRVEICSNGASTPAFDDEQALNQLRAQRTKTLGKPLRLPLKYNDQSTLVVSIQSTTDGQPMTLHYQLQSR